MTKGDFVTLLLSGTALREHDGEVAMVVSTTSYSHLPKEVYGVRVVSSQRMMHLFGRHLRPSTPVEILAAKLK